MTAGQTPHADLPAALLQALVAHAREELPNEACGVIAAIGRDLLHQPMMNADLSPTRFRFDAAQQLAVFHEIDNLGGEVAAIYHSHTKTEAWPSQTDIRYADPDVVQIIVSFMSEDPSLRAFKIRDGHVFELELKAYATGEAATPRRERRGVNIG